MPPPVTSGTDQLTVAEPLPGTTFTAPTGPGRSAPGETAADGSLALDEPVAPVPLATTVNV
ncbi:hypothetical protein GCM10020218_055860 [Dactylosporangium vinaceum]